MTTVPELLFLLQTLVPFHSFLDQHPHLGARPLLINLLEKVVLVYLMVVHLKVDWMVERVCQTHLVKLISNHSNIINNNLLN